MANGEHATLLIALLAAAFPGCESASPTSPTPPAAVLSPQPPNTSDLPSRYPVGGNPLRRCLRSDAGGARADP
jgi:hypothetical protein